MSVWVEMISAVTAVLSKMCHAPRERVSWNFIFSPCQFGKVIVTLHVSVWVEIRLRDEIVVVLIVTLHVSVWVEIVRSYICRLESGSRSTWACELKSSISTEFIVSLWSRSTWACELKWHLVDNVVYYNRHAPRERVSWNRTSQSFTGSLCHVTLHVSVWVEIFAWFICLFAKIVTLHVSVWVEIWILNGACG